MVGLTIWITNIDLISVWLPKQLVKLGQVAVALDLGHYFKKRFIIFFRHIFSFSTIKLKIETLNLTIQRILRVFSSPLNQSRVIIHNSELNFLSTLLSKSRSYTSTLAIPKTIGFVWIWIYLKYLFEIITVTLFVMSCTWDKKMVRNCVYDISKTKFENFIWKSYNPNKP